jgi:hypothetical protein
LAARKEREARRAVKKTAALPASVAASVQTERASS